MEQGANLDYIDETAAAGPRVPDDVVGQMSARGRRAILWYAGRLQYDPTIDVSIQTITEEELASLRAKGLEPPVRPLPARPSGQHPDEALRNR